MGSTPTISAKNRLSKKAVCFLFVWNGKKITKMEKGPDHILFSSSTVHLGRKRLCKPENIGFYSKNRNLWDKKRIFYCDLSWYTHVNKTDRES